MFRHSSGGSTGAMSMHADAADPSACPDTAEVDRLAPCRCMRTQLIRPHVPTPQKSIDWRRVDRCVRKERHRGCRTTASSSVSGVRNCCGRAGATGPLSYDSDGVVPHRQRPVAGGLAPHDPRQHRHRCGRKERHRGCRTTASSSVSGVRNCCGRAGATGPLSYDSDGVVPHRQRHGADTRQRHHAAAPCGSTAAAPCGSAAAAAAAAARRGGSGASARKRGTGRSGNPTGPFTTRGRATTRISPWLAADSDVVP
ncbi:hypothetical protein EDF27_3556 [Curtobacterium sp. PhB136]|nr:hypothetical protein EDF27_3556 [Curtobacterium sp. PhB136]